MENKRKFAAIFSSTIGLLVPVLIFSIMGLKIISGILTMIFANGTGILTMIFANDTGVLSLITQILGAGFLSLVAIGFLCCYLSGKNSDVSPSGLMCIRVYTMITGISSFIVYIIKGIVILIGMIVGGAVASYADSGMAAIIIIVLCLFLAYFIFMGVINLMYAVKMNGFLAAVRWSDRNSEILSVGFLRFFIILKIIFTSLGLIASIINMIIPMILEEVLDELGDMADVVLSFLGISTDGIAISIVGIFITLATLVVYICIFMLLGKVKVDIINNDAQEYENNMEDTNNYNEPLEYEHDDEGTDILSGKGEITYTEEPEVVEMPVVEEKPVIEEPKKVGHITAISGEEKGCSYPIEDGDEIIIGKDPKCAHIIVSNNYQKVSRIHCGVKYDAASDKYIVIDYSTNGTYINSITKGRLTKGVYTPLPKGTIINLSKEVIDFKLD